MQKQWKELNSFHTNREFIYQFFHYKLLVFVHDNPECSYIQYEDKAKKLGISYMSEEAFNRYGFGLSVELAK